MANFSTALENSHIENEISGPIVIPEGMWEIGAGISITNEYYSLASPYILYGITDNFEYILPALFSYRFYKNDTFQFAASGGVRSISYSSNAGTTTKNSIGIRAKQIVSKDFAAVYSVFDNFNYSTGDEEKTEYLSASFGGIYSFTEVIFITVSGRHVNSTGYVYKNMDRLISTLSYNFSNSFEGLFIVYISKYSKKNEPHILNELDEEFGSSGYEKEMTLTTTGVAAKWRF